jgi:hypothetical protein
MRRSELSQRANRVMTRRSELQPVSADVLSGLAVGADGHPHCKHRALARLARHRHITCHSRKSYPRVAMMQSEQNCFDCVAVLAYATAL